MARNQPEFPEPGKFKQKSGERREEHRIDAEVEDSFPASDPPSYAGGMHRAGAPKKPRTPAHKERH